MNDAASLPVVIGVSGHRDLRDEDRPHLEQRMREILLDLGARYPATPLQLLSLLAEGADQLAARVALDLGVSLVVVLPMPQAEYEQDFTTSQSRADFQDLLHRAGRSFELPAAGESDFGDDAAPGQAICLGRRLHCAPQPVPHRPVGRRPFARGRRHGRRGALQAGGRTTGPGLAAQCPGPRRERARLPPLDALAHASPTRGYPLCTNQVCPQGRRGPS